MSFDRVAAIYDATRVIPAMVIERIVELILAATQARPDTHFLDIGVGTGRFSIPFLESGYNVTGIDISEQMMHRLRDKVGQSKCLSLHVADARSIPFADGSFDVVLAMQVLHLIPEWRAALEEASRVLKPAGSLVLGSNQAISGPPADIRRRWRLLVQDEGAELPPKYGVFDKARIAIAEMSERTAVDEVIRWTSDTAPIAILEAIRTHTFSDSWNLPDDVMDRVHHRLVDWASIQYGDLQSPLPATGGFVVSINTL